MYDYLIVGSGLFGAVFAERMTSCGKKCLVVEKRPNVGGNAYTENADGIDLHIYGAHIFHTSDEKVWQYVNGFVSFYPFINMPKANFEGQLFSLPFNMNTFHELWGVNTAEEAKAKIEVDIAADHRENPANLEEQAINLVGREVYEKLVKGYTEKQWGRSCRELPAFIIRRLPLRFTFDNNYFNDRYQGVPRGGYTPLVKKLLQKCDVRLSTDYFSARSELNAAARKVVYTGPLDAFFGWKKGKLDYRSLRFETKRLNQPYFQSGAVVNYTGREVPFTRIIEHKYFEGTKAPYTYITHEYPEVFTGLNEPFYPVSDERNECLAASYREEAAAEKNTIFGGRLGTYRYLDMDKVVALALEAAEKETADFAVV